VFFKIVLNISAYFLPQETRGHFEESSRTFYISQRISGTVKMCVTNTETESIVHVRVVAKRKLQIRKIINYLQSTNQNSSHF